MRLSSNTRCYATVAKSSIIRYRQDNHIHALPSMLVASTHRKYPVEHEQDEYPAKPGLVPVSRVCGRRASVVVASTDLNSDKHKPLEAFTGAIGIENILTISQTQAATRGTETTVRPTSPRLRRPHASWSRMDRNAQPAGI